MENQKADIEIYGEGAMTTVYLATPLTQAGKDWLNEHIGSESTWLGNSLAVEHRYIADLIDGMRGDGLTVV